MCFLITHVSKKPFIYRDRNGEVTNMQVSPAKGHSSFAHLVFVQFPGKESWQLIRKAEIQISPSLRQIQTNGTSYDMKRSFRSQLETLTIFFLMVKTRGEKQKCLRISGTSATSKLTDSTILSLSIDNHQTLSTLNTKLTGWYR